MTLRRTEAEARAAAIRVDAMVVELDLTDPGAARFGSTTTIRFSSSAPATFVDFTGAELMSARLDGTELGADRWRDGRIWLDGLGGDHELVVAGAMTYSTSGEGLHRHVDPADGRTYLYAMSFLEAAPSWFACFDQPDLKSPYTFLVSAPDDWTLIGNGPTERLDDGRRRIVQSRPLATYFVTLVAGPYASVSAEHDGIALGLHARASLTAQLEASADELFTITRQCLDYYRTLFDRPYPFDDYHQAFVPDFNAGAMENPGCVTIRDQLLFRGRATRAERAKRAGLVAHEMAHMWFGDLVSMRWWDDLWLNESFAEYLAQRCCSEATDFPAWTDFGIARKEWGMVADQSPSTHPVAGNGAPDAESALQDFDGISYAKGAAVLRQLATQLGDPAFFGGLGRYFDAYAYGNASFADLIGHWAAASASGSDPGLDLPAWADAWLRTTGVDTLDVAGRAPQMMIVKRSGAGISPRIHQVEVAAVDATGALSPRQPVRLVDALTPVGVPVGSDLVLPDAGDATWAKIRFGAGGWAALRRALPRLRDESAQVVAFNALRDAVRDAELDPAEAFAVVVESVPHVGSELIVGQVLGFALDQLAGPYAKPTDRAERTGRVHDVALSVMERAAVGSDRQLVALRVALRSAVDDRVLRRWLDRGLPLGVSMDPELRWSLVRRIVALTGDHAVLDAATAADRSTAGRVHAAWCRAATPDPEAKRSAWALITQPSSLSAYELYATAEGFFEPGQSELTEAYVERYFAEIAATAAFRTGWMLGELATKAFPASAVSPPALALAEAFLATDGIAPPIRRAVVDATDKLRRALVALNRFE